ncbi:hypothetical protein P170DRAFT_420785 [Aspergillus steynii IBT 23096]|uniref:MYND-type domain-containing protein n=1 Tax=Aspergillus steynii IBT 23096 TaxID=1392250 RepID=A0A2I2GM84_9EURO|nr:uncharacterized protein P170DRAFT_420785 [Aspergillus steynii IBT 23096]PLB54001.1 hypothetical protein P170DRAFT_420785 [Aspergillus steynii IBT 23096]
MFSLNLLLSSGKCGFCKSFGGVICADCKIISYCNFDHKRRHKRRHKAQCQGFCELLAEYESEFERCSESHKEVLNALREKFMYYVLPNVSPGVVDYTLARFAVRYIFGTRKSLNVIKDEFEYLESLLEVFVENNYYAGWRISVILLKDGRDREFYDFVKETLLDVKEEFAPEPGKDYALQYIDDRGVDPFEDYNFFSADIDYRAPSLLIQSVGLILMKIKMLKDLEDLDASNNIIGRFVPREILNRIQYAIASNSILADNWRLLEAEDHTKPIEILKKQVEALFYGIDAINPFLWPFLVYDVKPGTGQAVDFPNPEAASEHAHRVVRELSGVRLKAPGALNLIADRYIPILGYSYRNLKIRDKPLMGDGRYFDNIIGHDAQL